MIRGFALRMVITFYVLCVLGYNFFGTSSSGWTNFYYTFEKGFAFLSLCFDYNRERLTDKMCIDFARILQIGTWVFFLLCSFNGTAWAYHQTFVVSMIIISTFGSLIVLYMYIRKGIKS